MKTKMKSLVLMAAGLMTAFSLIGCGGETQDTSSGSDANQEAPANDDASTPEAGSGYLFEVNGVALGADMDMAEFVDALGDANDVFEAPSCAGQGTAYVYDYGSFEIETYPDGEVNRIGYIILKDDTVATAEGIDLSKTKDDIIAAYGEDYVENDNGLTYEKDNMKLNFIFDGENIVSIEFVSAVIG